MQSTGHGGLMVALAAVMPAALAPAALSHLQRHSHSCCLSVSMPTCWTPNAHHPPLPPRHPGNTPLPIACGGGCRHKNTVQVPPQRQHHHQQSRHACKDRKPLCKTKHSNPTVYTHMYKVSSRWGQLHAMGCLLVVPTGQGLDWAGQKAGQCPAAWPPCTVSGGAARVPAAPLPLCTVARMHVLAWHAPLSDLWAP
jgi:hypothetical protein